MEMDVYAQCPTVTTESFALRLVRVEDAGTLFGCYHDAAAVRLMNADNCDFGFYTETQETMEETIRYWVDFYKKRCFVRFAVVARETGEAIGTVEGFAGDVGVLRIDLATAYEKAGRIAELLRFAQERFYDLFGNAMLVTKAIPAAEERRKALDACGWKDIGEYRGYPDYFEMKTIQK